MSISAKLLALLVIVFHASVFVVEAFLWMLPPVYEVSIAKLNADVSLDFYQQALVLKILFINQGFYNLFLAVAGGIGIVLIQRSYLQAGYALVCYMCLSAVGAGVVLALSANAYISGCVQALPGLAALVAIYVTFPKKIVMNKSS